MNLDFSEEQEMLRKLARDFLDKECPKSLVREMEDHSTTFDAGLWKKMAELGWMGLIVPGRYGGSDGSFMDLVVLLEETGRACLVSPFLSTVLCTLPILSLGSEEQKKKLLPSIAAGDTVLALALTEPSASYNAAGIATSAALEKGKYILNGTKLFIQDAQAAHYLLCAARTRAWAAPEESITLFLVPAQSRGITITPLDTIADDRQCEVLLQNVEVSQEDVLGGVGRGWPAVERLLEQAAVAKCAEMLGGFDWTTENCVAYAKDRVQYGRPIGQFGIIQHYLADMWTEMNLAKRLTYYAAWHIEKGLPCAREVAMAKAWVSDSYRRCTRTGVQVYGGIGTTRDHDMGLYYRRARQAALLFGDPDSCRERVAQEIGL